jgi:hypothetical protein
VTAHGKATKEDQGYIAEPVARAPGLVRGDRNRRESAESSSAPTGWLDRLDAVPDAEIGLAQSFGRRGLGRQPAFA